MKWHARIRLSDNRELSYPLVRGLDHGRSSQSWGPTVEVHHSRRPGRGRRVGTGRVPRGRRQVRRGGWAVDHLSMARSWPPGRSSVPPAGGGRGAVLGRRENRPDGWKNSDPPSGGSENRLSVQQRKEQRKNGTGSSRNPGAPPADRFENPFPLQAVESPPETFPKPRSHHGCGMMLPRMSYRPDRDVAASRFRPWKSIVRSGERSTANDVGGGMTQADTDWEIRARFDRQASATRQRSVPRVSSDADS